MVNHRVVFVGTGKYLEGDDLADKQLQTLYAIKDDNNTFDTKSVFGPSYTDYVNGKANDG